MNLRVALASLAGMCVGVVFVNEIWQPEKVNYHLLNLNLIIIPVLVLLGLMYDLKHPYLTGGLLSIIIPIFSIDRYLPYLIGKRMETINLLGVEHLYSAFHELLYLIVFSFIAGSIVCAAANDVRVFFLRRKWLLTEKDIVDWEKFKSSLKKIAEEKKLQFYCVNLMNKIEKIVTKTELSAKDRKQIVKLTNELLLKTDIFDIDNIVAKNVEADPALFADTIRKKLDVDEMLKLNRTYLVNIMPDVVNPSCQASR